MKSAILFLFIAAVLCEAVALAWRLWATFRCPFVYDVLLHYRRASRLTDISLKLAAAGLIGLFIVWLTA